MRDRWALTPSSQQASESGGTESFGMPISRAKLAVPSLPPHHVDRPNIRAALDRARKVILIVAPAGFGKTATAAHWVGDGNSGVAWVRLGDADNDPARLWTYLASAVDLIRPGLGRRGRELASRGAVSVTPAVDAVLDGCAAYGDGIVIVLDAFHVISEPRVLASVDYALEHLPGNVRLVLIARDAPPLRLARYRAAGEITDIGPRELAFSLPETRAALRKFGVDVGGDALAAIQSRTGGWPALVSLTGLWLGGTPDAAAALELAGDVPVIAEYMSQEVIAGLGPELRRFTEQAAALGNFAAAQCEAVFGARDAAVHIAELCRRNLCAVTAGAGGLVEMHPLVAAAAASDLEAREPGATTALRRRAAVWLRDQRLVAAALAQASAAGDQELLVAILVDEHLHLLRSGRAFTLLRWTRTVPDARLRRHPVLAVAAATASLMLTAPIEERLHYIEIASNGSAHLDPARRDYVNAALAMVRTMTISGSVGDAVRSGRLAVAAAAGQPEVRVSALAALACAMYLAGDEGALGVAREAIEDPHVARRPAGHALARAMLAIVAADDDALRVAREHAQQAVALSRALGDDRGLTATWARTAMGLVLAAEGDLVQAERLLARAERDARETIPTVPHAWVLVALARVSLRRGRVDRARRYEGQARERAREFADPGRVTRDLAALSAELARVEAEATRSSVVRPSASEAAVLRMLATDLTLRQIAQRMFLSPNTVKSHVRVLYRKLGVTSREDAVARALALGLIEDTESPG